MNEQQILELEKQLIPDLPKDFWKIRDQAEIEADFWDRLLYIGLAIGAVFQVICLISLIFLKPTEEELKFSPQQQKNKQSKEDKRRKKRN